MEDKTQESYLVENTNTNLYAWYELFVLLLNSDNSISSKFINKSEHRKNKGYENQIQKKQR